MSAFAGPELLVRRTAAGTPARREAAVPRLLVGVWAALCHQRSRLRRRGREARARPGRGSGSCFAQGSLVLALLLALVLNRRVVLRPDLFLVLLTGLGVLALMVSIRDEFVFGSTYRALRLLLFIVVLWLLSPWWGRRDMLLLRCHRRLLWILLTMVILGAAVAPGLAFSFDGRLASVLWPIWPTQVAHLAAVLLGTSLVLWMCQVISGRNAVLTLAVAGAVMVATHTRTAIVATLVGLAVATTSLLLGHVRARRLSVVGVVATVAVATFFASGLTAWAMRGQSARQASQLTGRTKVWSEVSAAHRPRLEELFGSGLSNQSFNGLPIDSTWWGMYVDQGLIGVVILATALLFLLIMAAMHERGPHRAVALFLVIYCVIASITETGPGSSTMYTLDLAVAASLVAPSGSRRSAGSGSDDLDGVGRWDIRSRTFGRDAGRRQEWGRDMPDEQGSDKVLARWGHEQIRGSARQGRHDHRGQRVRRIGRPC